MKHIVHVSNDFEPLSSGINTHLKNVLACLSQNDLQITLLVPTGLDSFKDEIVSEESPHFKIIRSNYKKTNNRLLKLLYLTYSTMSGLKWIQDEVGSIDLIHQHDQRATRLGATRFARSNNIPIIWTNHSPDYFGRSEVVTRWLSKITRQKPDGIIAVHHEMAELFHSSRYSKLPIKYISNGVDPGHFSYKEIKPINGKIAVLYPQRMVSMKGPEFLAKAAVQILKEQNSTEFSFYFAGSEPSSNRNQSTIREVKEILNQYADGQRVTYLGNPSYEEMPAYYDRADIVVLPLQIETENISVFEAWASGTPLITTTQVEKNGYMKDKENCLIVPKRDPQKLAEAIIRLAENLQLRQKLAANGRELVQKQFKWSHMAEKTSKFYREILNDSDL